MLGDRNSQHSFSQIPQINTGRSMFDRSFALKDIYYFDNLTPIFVDEILPGDTSNVTMAMFARLATQIVPIMDNLYVDFFFFFVPNRLVWTNWEKFMGAQDNPGDSIDYVIPGTAPLEDANAVDTIWDKMGIPVGSTGDFGVPNVLPFRAYNLIWNEWFRDQNLQNSVTVLMDDGPDPVDTYTLLKRGKRHDYFTSCLPNPQKGTAVSIPIGLNAPVLTNSTVPNFTGVGSGIVNQGLYSDSVGGVNTLITTGSSAAEQELTFGSNSGLYTDLQAGNIGTINQLRQAFQIQSLLELDQRGGTRYVELLQAHFNVTSPDFRLQRPEYIGGGSVKINGHPVPQTAPTTGSNYQGQLAAFATASSAGKIGFSKTFTEHGYVLGLACPRADITYQQGFNRLWTRQTRYDFFWPKLQELGEQAVLNQEIYFQGTSADQDVFGYQERYAEYRYKPSEIHGYFRSTVSGTLDYWHMAEDFGSLPSLNASFIQQNTPITRALANTDAPQLLFDAYFTYKHARPMLAYSIPVSLGRF